MTKLRCLKGHFCSHTIFNLRHGVLSDAEIKVLEKGLNFAPVQRKINETDLKEDFEEFVAAQELNGIFGMSLQNLLVTSQSFAVNPIGNLLKVTLI